MRISDWSSDVCSSDLSFGGIRAVDGVSIDVAKGEVFNIIGPNGDGKTTVFNLISRIYDPTEGRIVFDGADITALAPYRIAGLGIAHTFQNIELFEHATVLHNLLLGRHARRGGQHLLAEMLFLPSVRRTELAHREEVEHVIDFLDLQHYRDTLIVNLPYGDRQSPRLNSSHYCAAH